MGRDNGSHTTYLVGEAMALASLFLEPTVAMSSDWFPRPPTMYTRRGIRKLTVGAPVAQPWGER
jgi:hypothetical protein